MTFSREMRSFAPVPAQSTCSRALSWAVLGSCLVLVVAITQYAHRLDGNQSFGDGLIQKRQKAFYLFSAIHDLDDHRQIGRELQEFRRVYPAVGAEAHRTTQDGRAITGARVNEDAFSIQIRDVSGKVYSFWKEELKELHKDWGKSPMPSYRDKLTPAEIEDLVSYLASLRGKK